MYRSLLKLGNVSAIKCSLQRKRFESCKIHISSSVLQNEIGLKVTECIYHQVKAGGLKLGNVYCPIDTIGKVCIKVGGGGVVGNLSKHHMCLNHDCPLHITHPCICPHIAVILASGHSHILLGKVRLYIANGGNSQ